MQKCLMLYDDSLKYSRATYGLLTLIAFLIRSQWLLLAVAILMMLGTFTIKLNIPYQIHSFLFKKSLVKASTPVSRDSGEITFVSGMTAILLLIGFLFIYFNIYIELAWIYILIVSLLIFLACFVGFCVATLIYIMIKKIVRRNKKTKA